MIASSSPTLEVTRQNLAEVLCDLPFPFPFPFPFPGPRSRPADKNLMNFELLHGNPEARQNHRNKLYKRSDAI